MLEPESAIMVSGVPLMVISNNGCLLRHCRRRSPFLLYGLSLGFPVGQVFVGTIADSVWWVEAMFVLETYGLKVVEFSTGTTFFPVGRTTGFPTFMGICASTVMTFHTGAGVPGLLLTGFFVRVDVVIVVVLATSGCEMANVFCSLEVRCLGVG